MYALKTDGQLTSSVLLPRNNVYITDK